MTNDNTLKRYLSGRGDRDRSLTVNRTNLLVIINHV